MKGLSLMALDSYTEQNYMIYIQIHKRHRICHTPDDYIHLVGGTKTKFQIITLFGTIDKHIIFRFSTNITIYYMWDIVYMSMFMNLVTRQSLSYENHIFHITSIMKHWKVETCIKCSPALHDQSEPISCKLLSDISHWCPYSTVWFQVQSASTCPAESDPTSPPND
jgi:hypothetical protein